MNNFMEIKNSLRQQLSNITTCFAFFSNLCINFSSWKALGRIYAYMIIIYCPKTHTIQNCGGGGSVTCKCTCTCVIALVTQFAHLMSLGPIHEALRPILHPYFELTGISDNSHKSGEIIRDIHREILKNIQK